MSRFEAGAASVDATPGPEHIDNSIHSTMRLDDKRRGSALRAKAIALRLGPTTGLLVTLDLVFLLRPHCDLLRARLRVATAVPVDDIVIHWTHSHSTPFVEPLDGPHPYFDLLCDRAERAASEAMAALRPARFGFGQTHAVGASYNTRIPVGDDGVKYVRDYREGLASGRPIDPRLSVIRLDDEQGRPIAGWARFAAHPSIVIFDAPLSAEYPGYLTDRLEEKTTAGAPFCFNVGACGDVNPVPMFGSEEDCRRLGETLAGLLAPVFDDIVTESPRHLGLASGSAQLPLDRPPDVATLDAEIAELDGFLGGLDDDPTGEWVLGINVLPEWPASHKRDHFAPVREWAVKMKEALAEGRSFQRTWTSPISAWVIDDIGLLFYGGEPFVELGLAIAAGSPLREALVMPMGNGSDGYLAPDAERRRGGYETYTNPRYARLAPDHRPLPYALGAADIFVERALALLTEARP